jgi:hypothetical protein
LYLDSLRCFLSSKPFVDSLLIQNWWNEVSKKNLSWHKWRTNDWGNTTQTRKGTGLNISFVYTDLCKLTDLTALSGISLPLAHTGKMIFHPFQVKFPYILLNEYLPKIARRNRSRVGIATKALGGRGWEEIGQSSSSWSSRPKSRNL